MIEQMKCPACGGNILSDEGKDVFFCPYCGVKLAQKKTALDKIIRHREQSQQFAEEVRQRKVREQIAAESRKEAKDRKGLFLALAFFAVMLILVIIVSVSGIRGENNSEAELKALVVEIQADVEAGNYDVALIKAEQLHWPHGDTVGIKRWDEQRKALVKVIRDAKKSAGK